MSESQKQTEFLKHIIGLEDTTAARNLQERLKQLQGNVQCLRRMLGLMTVLAFISLAGLCYSSLFIEGKFDPQTLPMIVKFCCVLGLGSVICICIVLGYWVWFRGVLNGVHEECRRVIRHMLQPSFLPGNDPSR